MMVFLSACSDCSLQEELLKLLLSLLLTLNPTGLAGHLWAEGLPLMVLIRAESMSVRLITIKVSHRTPSLTQSHMYVTSSLLDSLSSLYAPRRGFNKSTPLSPQFRLSGCCYLPDDPTRSLIISHTSPVGALCSQAKGSHWYYIYTQSYVCTNT